MKIRTVAKLDEMESTAAGDGLSLMADSHARLCIKMAEFFFRLEQAVRAKCEHDIGRRALCLQPLLAFQRDVVRAGAVVLLQVIEIQNHLGMRFGQFMESDLAGG